MTTTDHAMPELLPCQSERSLSESPKVIASDFGISESLPREIVRGSCWPDALLAAKQILEASNGNA